MTNWLFINYNILQLIDTEQYKLGQRFSIILSDTARTYKEYQYISEETDRPRKKRLDRDRFV